VIKRAQKGDFNLANKKFTEEQIIGILQEGEAGAKIAELCRRHGVSDAIFYRWKYKYAGISLSELKRLKALEDENKAEMKERISTPQARESMEELLATQKTIQQLVEIARGPQDDSPKK
jgi:putative transposase